MVQFFEKRIFCCEILSCEFVFKTILIAVLQNVKKIQFYKHSAVYLYRAYREKAKVFQMT
jgi:hypothetical protein